MVQVILRRNGFSYGFAILRFGSEMRGVNDGFEEGQQGIRIGLSKLMRDGETQQGCLAQMSFESMKINPAFSYTAR